MASYDPESGQVYREWTIANPTLTSSSDRDWSRAPPTATPRARGPPKSLVALTTAVVAKNAGLLTEDMVDRIPPRMRLRVWQYLEARFVPCLYMHVSYLLTEANRGVNLHAWKILSKYLLRGEDHSEPTLSQYRYRQHICDPSHALSVYTEPLTSPTCAFITHLVISGSCDFSTSEMVSLAQMPNLGVLEIMQPADELRVIFPQVTDRLIRGWINTPNPFPLLRILRIWGDQTTTQDSLKHLANLPSLALYDVMGSRDDWQRAEEYGVASGWELAESASRMEDSLLRYLMLFAPDREARLQRRKDMSARIDLDLTSLCEDSSSVVKFVPYGEAPELLDYLTNGSIEPPKRDEFPSGNARSCKGVAFEPWAFWLYSFIGQIKGDEELSTETQAVAGPFVLPSKPMACVFLGHNGRGGIASRPSYIRRGLFATQRYTFTRTEMPIQKEEAIKQKWKKTEKKNTINPRKRQRLDDMLGPFG